MSDIIPEGKLAFVDVSVHDCFVTENLYYYKKVLGFYSNGEDGFFCNAMLLLSPEYSTEENEDGTLEKFVVFKKARSKYGYLPVSTTIVQRVDHLPKTRTFHPLPFVPQ